MSPRKPAILRTEVPIFGQGSDLAQTLQNFAQYVQEALQALVHDVQVLNARLSKVEVDSTRNVNVYINPKEVPKLEIKKEELTTNVKSVKEESTTNAS